jgi:hypothetical protein
MNIDDLIIGFEPARIIYKRGFQKKYNQVAGEKIDGVQITEGELESNIGEAAGLDPRVERILHQPCVFELNSGRWYRSREHLAHHHGSKAKTYTPDYLFVLKNAGHCFVEGKHTGLISKSEAFRKKIQRVKELGLPFCLITEEFFSEDFVRNIRMLRPYAHKILSIESMRKVETFTAQERSIGELRAEGLSQFELMTGIARGLLKINMRAGALGPHTMVSRSHRSTAHLEILPL